MSTPKRVLVLTTTFPRWKDDTDPPFVYELSRRLLVGYRITVLAPHYPGGSAKEDFAGLRVHRYRYFFSPWERLAYGSGGGILQRLRHRPAYWVTVPCLILGQLLALCRLLRRHRFDLIHAHWLIPQGLVALIAKSICRADLPVICTAHGGDLFGLKGTGLENVKKFVARRSDAITVVSRAMKKELIRLGSDPDRVHVLPMGTDLERVFTPKEGDRDVNRCCSWGGWWKKKGCGF